MPVGVHVDGLGLGLGLGLNSYIEIHWQNIKRHTIVHIKVAQGEVVRMSKFRAKSEGKLEMTFRALDTH